MDQLLRVLDGHVGAIHAVRLTNDGAYCLTASADRTLKLWNPHKSDPSKSGSADQALCIQTYTGAHGYPVLDVAVAQDKSKFLSAGEDRACFLWDVASSRVVRRIQAHSQRTNAVMFNQYDTVAFTASYDGTVKCWDLRSASRDPIQTMDDFKDSVTSLARTDVAILAGSVDGCVRMYDMRQGCMLADSLRDPITALVTSPDQRAYLATQLGGFVRMVDMAGGKLLKEYRGHSHDAYKQEAAYEFGDKRIVTGTADGSIVHYDLLTGNVAHCTKQAHFKAISGIACHPTMPCLLTSSHDGMAKVWTTSQA